MAKLFKGMFKKDGAPMPSTKEESTNSSASSSTRQSESASLHTEDKEATLKDSTAQQSENRRIRVFVSSTFRDMMEERELLMTHTWPELRRFCRERQLELVEVDLRWGITEEQSTRKETLKLCLNEIRACRPFFIGLLGERYGWVPGDDAFTADLNEEQAWLKDLRGKSVTELEILHGVLNNPEIATCAFFYFRDPKYVNSVPQEKRSDFVSEGPASAEKQEALKNLIRKTCAARKIPLYENYPDPKSLAPVILKQLEDAIDKRFPKENIPDPLAREARDHEAFAEIRRRTYVGRPDYFKALDQHCYGDGPPLILLGDSGSGKSALIANWVEHWRREHPRDYVFQHYIGGTADSAVHWKIMSRLMAEIKKWSGDSEELPRSHDDLLRRFPLWLAKARIKASQDGSKFIVILDALNQLEDRDHAHLLGWLPFESFFGNLRLIVSTLPGDTLEVLEKRPWIHVRVEPLTWEERALIIVDYLNRFGKKLDKPRLDRLSNTSAAANPLYLKTLLDELRVTGTHQGLDERLDDYLSATDIPSLLTKVLRRYQKDYEQDRKGLVSETLGLIWSARRGLTENELLQILRPENFAQLPAAMWAPLRAVLEESLVDRGGVLNFAHDFLRIAVEALFVPDPDRKTHFRLQLADYFSAQPNNERSCDELPWLLHQSKSYRRLRDCLLNIDNCIQIFRRDEEELRRYWINLGEEKKLGQAYRESFDKWRARPENCEKDIAFTSLVLADILYHASLYEQAEYFYRLSLDICQNGPLQNEVLRMLNILDNFASLLHNTNRFNEAESLMRRAVKMCEERFGISHPKVAEELSHLAVIFYKTNRLAEAEVILRRALKIKEEFYGENDALLATDLNNLAMLLKDTNRISEAEPLLRRALEIDEKTYGKEHPLVAGTLLCFANLLACTNRKSEAENLMRRALKIYEDHLGRSHPWVANALNELAMLLKDTNRSREALPLAERALNIAEEAYGKDHTDIALYLNNLTVLLCSCGRFSEAEPLMRRSAEIFANSSRATGFEHPRLRDTLNNYGYLLHTMGWSNEQILTQLQKILPEYFSKNQQ